MPSTDDWTMPVLTCLVCDKDRDPLDVPDEPCGHGREYRHVVLVPVMPRRVTDETVDRAAVVIEDTLEIDRDAARALATRAVAAAFGNKHDTGDDA